MLNIVWAKFEKSNFYNFGDDLTPYLFNKLTDERYRYVKFACTRIQILKQFISGVLHGKFSIIYLKQFVIGLFIKKYIVSIGSVLSAYSSSRCIVWGTGIISENEKIRKSIFLAVRGKYTLNAVRKTGCNTPITLGDPALLLPIVYEPTVRKVYKLGIIPHIIHYEYVMNFFISDEINVINLNCSDTEKIVNEIFSCEYTISTSLHGLIVSHAYGIKSLWYQIPEIPLWGDGVKFNDYFSSVKIPEYKPFTLTQNLDIDYIIHNIEENNHINKMYIDLKSLQKELLNVAPFLVRDEVLKNIK